MILYIEVKGIKQKLFKDKTHPISEFGRQVFQLILFKMRGLGEFYKWNIFWSGYYLGGRSLRMFLVFLEPMPLNLKTRAIVTSRLDGCMPN